jgi:hypothetical protein
MIHVVSAVSADRHQKGIGLGERYIPLDQDLYTRF